MPTSKRAGFQFGRRLGLHQAIQVIRDNDCNLTEGQVKRLIGKMHAAIHTVTSHPDDVRAWANQEED